MTGACGCTDKRDREAWHRYWQTPICAGAREARRDYDRRKYARRRQREGRPVREHGERRRGWVPGSAIEVPELDPL